MVANQSVGRNQMQQLATTRAIVLALALCGLQACGDDAIGTEGSGDATDGTTNLDATAAQDATDGTDGAESTDTVDGVDGMDGSVGVDETDAPPKPNQLSTVSIAAITGPVVHQGALASSGDLVAWCDGNTLRSHATNGASEIQTISLESDCIAVALDEGTPIVVTAAGQWIRDPGGSAVSVAGPTVIRLRNFDGQLYGTMGTSELAIAEATLTTPPELIETNEAGVRDIALIDDDWVLALGTGGVKRISPSGITQGSYLTAPSMANSVAIHSSGSILVAVAGQGLAVLDASSLAEVSRTEAKGVSLEVTAGIGGLSNYALVADWRQAQLVDLSNPAEASPIVREEFRYNTEHSRVISVVTTATGFAAIGLNHVSRLLTGVGEPLPQMFLDQRRRKLAISEELGNGAVGLVIFNDGAAPLTLSNFNATSDRITPNEIPEVISPNNVEFMQVDIAGSAPLEGSFSFDTNDPDNPTVEYTVQVNPALLAVGDAAPDFFVPTTDGGFSTLSKVSGTVSYLKFFNAL